jgi:cellulose 1,4-beta-cellobiosidase
MMSFGYPLSATNRAVIPFGRWSSLCALGGVLACGAATSPGPRSAPVSEKPARGNPFDDAIFYVDPEYVVKVERAAAAHPAEAERLRRVEAFPTAVWLDSMKNARLAGRHLDEALATQRQAGRAVVSVFVLYDIPGRDCAAEASSGELDLQSGMGHYETDFIDVVATQFRDHSSQRIVAILEPDSLANLATNLGIAKCQTAEHAYRQAISYALRKLAMPHVSLYLDAAHAGWLGWDGNRAKIAHIFREVLDDAGGVDLVRGFSTNVSNFNTLSDRDGQRLEPSTPCPDELTYVEKLSSSLAEVGITGKGFIIDTGRNGRGGIRSKWGVWCNVKGAGLGQRPRASPAPGVDAYFWVKPPGDSDGASEASSPGYDVSCAGEGSARGAPAAGRWFEEYFLDLAKNATPPL